MLYGLYACLLKAHNEASNHIIPVGIISGDSHCPYGLSVYLISMCLRGLPNSFLLFWEKGGGKYSRQVKS